MHRWSQHSKHMRNASENGHLTTQAFHFPSTNLAYFQITKHRKRKRYQISRHSKVRNKLHFPMLAQYSTVFALEGSIENLQFKLSVKCMSWIVNRIPKPSALTSKPSFGTIYEKQSQAFDLRCRVNEEAERTAKHTRKHTGTRRYTHRRARTRE